MAKLFDRVANEPVLVTAVIAAILNLVIALGVPVDEELKVAILAVVNTVLALFAREQVTPSRKL